MKNHRNIFILGILLFALLVAVGGYVYFFSQFKNKQESITAIREEVRVENEAQSATLSLKKTIREIEADQSALDTHFIKNTEIIGFIKFIESLGTLSSTKLSIDNAEALETSAKKPVLSISIQAEGSFQNINHLILLIENMPYETSITQVSMMRIQNPSATLTDPKTGKITTVPSSGPARWSADIQFIVSSFEK